MEILTGIVVSGIVWDILKAGSLLTAKNIKNYFAEELIEINDIQARQVSEQAKNLDLNTSSLESRDQFINKYKNYFKIDNIDNSINQNINSLTNSGTLLSNNANNITQNVNLPEQPVQKKS